MKKLFAEILCAAAICSVSAGESLLQNGGFEEITQYAKGTTKWLLRQIKGGWDVDSGPLAELPKFWMPNGGKGKIRVITVGENDENKENVHSGKHAISFESRGGQFMNTAPNFKPGKYEIKFWAKGNAILAFANYNYGENPSTGRINKFLYSMTLWSVMVDTQGEWKEYSKIVEIGTDKPEIRGCAFAIYGKTGSCYLDDVSLTPAK